MRWEKVTCPRCGRSARNIDYPVDRGGLACSRCYLEAGDKAVELDHTLAEEPEPLQQPVYARIGPLGIISYGPGPNATYGAGTRTRDSLEPPRR
jgi:hypothetical protein